MLFSVKNHIQCKKLLSKIRTLQNVIPLLCWTITWTYNFIWKCYGFLCCTCFTLFLFSNTSLGFVFRGTNWFGSSILIGVPPLVLEESSAFIHLKKKKKLKASAWWAGTILSVVLLLQKRYKERTFWLYFNSTWHSQNNPNSLQVCTFAQKSLSCLKHVSSRLLFVNTEIHSWKM